MNVSEIIANATESQLILLKIGLVEAATELHEIIAAFRADQTVIDVSRSVVLAGFAVALMV